MKSSLLNQVFKTPFRVAILSILVSSVLSEILSAIFFGFQPKSFLLIFVMTAIISGLVAYFASKGIIDLRLTVEDQKVQIALEHKRADILAKFIRNAAHEFKTPLTLMETNLYLLERSVDAQKKQQYSQQASDQITVLNTLLDSILVLTRLDSIDKADYPREQAPAKDLVTNLQSVTGRERLKFRIDDLHASVSVRVNIFDIHYALKQIVSNALRYSPNTSDVIISAARDGGWFHVQITDQGNGMSAETLQHVFDRFYRADESHTTRGMGLGLAIAKRVIELHDGRIEIQSEVGIGTTVQVYLLASN